MRAVAFAAVVLAALAGAARALVDAEREVGAAAAKWTGASADAAITLIKATALRGIDFSETRSSLLASGVDGEVAAPLHFADAYDIQLYTVDNTFVIQEDGEVPDFAGIPNTKAGVAIFRTCSADGVTHIRIMGELFDNGKAVKKAGSKSISSDFTMTKVINFDPINIDAKEADVVYLCVAELHLEFTASKSQKKEFRVMRVFCDAADTSLCELRRKALLALTQFHFTCSASKTSAADRQDFNKMQNTLQGIDQEATTLQQRSLQYGIEIEAKIKGIFKKKTALVKDIGKTLNLANRVEGAIKIKEGKIRAKYEEKERMDFIIDEQKKSVNTIEGDITKQLGGIADRRKTVALPPPLPPLEKDPMNSILDLTAKVNEVKNFQGKVLQFIQDNADKIVSTSSLVMDISNDILINDGAGNAAALDGAGDAAALQCDQLPEAVTLLNRVTGLSADWARLQNEFVDEKVRPAPVLLATNAGVAAFSKGPVLYRSKYGINRWRPNTLLLQCDASCNNELSIGWAATLTDTATRFCIKKNKDNNAVAMSCRKAELPPYIRVKRSADAVCVALGTGVEQADTVRLKTLESTKTKKGNMFWLRVKLQELEMDAINFFSARCSRYAVAKSKVAMPKEDMSVTHERTRASLEKDVRTLANIACSNKKHFDALESIDGMYGEYLETIQNTKTKLEEAAKDEFGRLRVLYWFAKDAVASIAKAARNFLVEKWASVKVATNNVKERTKHAFKRAKEFVERVLVGPGDVYDKAIDPVRYNEAFKKAVSNHPAAILKSLGSANKFIAYDEPVTVQALRSKFHRDASTSLEWSAVFTGHVYRDMQFYFPAPFLDLYYTTTTKVIKTAVAKAKKYTVLVNTYEELGRVMQKAESNALQASGGKAGSQFAAANNPLLPPPQQPKEDPLLADPIEQCKVEQPLVTWHSSGGIFRSLYFFNRIVPTECGKFALAYTQFGKLASYDGCGRGGNAKSASRNDKKLRKSMKSKETAEEKEKEKKEEKKAADEKIAKALAQWPKLDDKDREAIISALSIKKTAEKGLVDMWKIKFVNDWNALNKKSRAAYIDLLKKEDAMKEKIADLRITLPAMTVRGADTIKVERQKKKISDWENGQEVYTAMRKALGSTENALLGRFLEQVKDVKESVDALVALNDELYELTALKKQQKRSKKALAAKENDYSKVQEKQASTHMCLCVALANDSPSQTAHKFDHAKPTFVIVARLWIEKKTAEDIIERTRKIFKVSNACPAQPLPASWVRQKNVGDFFAKAALAKISIVPFHPLPTESKYLVWTDSKDVDWYKIKVPSMGTTDYYCVYRRYSHFKKLLNHISANDYDYLKRNDYLPTYALTKSAKTKNRFQAFGSMLSYLAAGDTTFHADDYSRAALLDFLTPDEVIRAAIRHRHSEKTTFLNQDGTANDDFFYANKRVKKLLVESTGDEYDGGLSYYNVYKPNSAAKSTYAGPFLSKSAPYGMQPDQYAKLLSNWKKCPPE